MLVARGFNASAFDTDESALDALLGVAQQFQDARPYIELGRQAAQQKPPETPPEAPKSPIDWPAVDYDPAWERFCERGEDGMWKPLGNAPQFLRYAERLNEAYEAQRRNLLRLSNSYPELHKQLSEHYWSTQKDEFKKELLEEFDQRQAAQIAEYEARQRLEQRQAEFFETDAAGQLKLDPRTGQPALTAKGTAFRNHLQQARGRNLPEDMAWEFAEAKLVADEAKGAFGSPPQQPPQQSSDVPTPEEIAAQKRQTFMDQAMAQRDTNRDGTFPEQPHQPPAVAEYRSARELAQEVLAEAGVTT